MSAPLRVLSYGVRPRKVARKATETEAFPRKIGAIENLEHGVP